MDEDQTDRAMDLLIEVDVHVDLDQEAVLFAVADLLIALTSALLGMCSIHADITREAIAKLCTLPLLAGGTGVVLTDGQVLAQGPVPAAGLAGARPGQGPEAR